MRLNQCRIWNMSQRKINDTRGFVGMVAMVLNETYLCVSGSLHSSAHKKQKIWGPQTPKEKTLFKTPPLTQYH